VGSGASRNQIWCIFALKDEIWWQNFLIFSQEYTDKLAHLVQFKRMLMFCVEDWGAWALLTPPLVYATERLRLKCILRTAQTRRVTYINAHQAGNCMRGQQAQ